jgi:hypothetical protein
MNGLYTFLIRYRSGGTPSTSPSQGVCRTSGPLTEGPGPTSSPGSLPAPRVACRCSPVGYRTEFIKFEVANFESSYHAIQVDTFSGKFRK